MRKRIQIGLAAALLALLAATPAMAQASVGLVVNGNPSTTNAPFVHDLPAQLRTYAAATTAKTATAAGTGPFFAICGDSTAAPNTKIVRVQEIDIGGAIGTTAVNVDVIIKKTSTATSAGTATALTKVPLDSGAAASAVSLLNYYTALATAGTAVGAIDSRTAFFPVAPALGSTVQFRWNEPSMAEAATLRSGSECLEASFGTTTTNAPTLTVSVRWTEAGTQ